MYSSISQLYGQGSQYPTYGSRITVNKDGKPVATVNIGDQSNTDPAISGSVQITPSVSVDVKVPVKDIVNAVDWLLRKYKGGN